MRISFSKNAYKKRKIKISKKTVGTLSGFQDFFLQPIIKNRPNNQNYTCRLALERHWFISSMY